MNDTNKKGVGSNVRSFAKAYFLRLLRGSFVDPGGLPKTAVGFLTGAEAEVEVDAAWSWCWVKEEVEESAMAEL